MSSRGRHDTVKTYCRREMHTNHVVSGSVLSWDTYRSDASLLAHQAYYHEDVFVTSAIFLTSLRVAVASICAKSWHTRLTVNHQGGLFWFAPKSNQTFSRSESSLVSGVLMLCLVSRPRRFEWYPFTQRIVTEGLISNATALDLAFLIFPRTYRGMNYQHNIKFDVFNIQ